MTSRSARAVSPDPGLFDVPAIRTPVPSAPGSASSERAADSVTNPMRARCHRAVMNALATANGPVSRESLSGTTGIKESTLCARLSDLVPLWVECLEDACIASSGLKVNGYRLTQAGRNRTREAA
jgi:hypothetical protein